MNYCWTPVLSSVYSIANRRFIKLAPFYRGWEGKVVTSEAVITEATHLLSAAPGGGTACLDFIFRNSKLWAVPVRRTDS